LNGVPCLIGGVTEIIFLVTELVDPGFLPRFLGCDELPLSGLKLSLTKKSYSTAYAFFVGSGLFLTIGLFCFLFASPMGTKE